MKPAQIQQIHFTANLSLFNKAAIGCTVTQLSSLGVFVLINDKNNAQLQTLVLDDLAELHIDNPAAPNSSPLKIRTTVDSINSNSLRLLYIKPEDSAVRQLLNWFSINETDLRQQSTLSTSDIFNKVNKTVLEQFSYYIEFFLSEADSQLLGLVEAAKSNEQQSKIFAIKSVLKNNSSEIKSLSCHYLLRKFDSSRIDCEESNLDEEMALVEFDAFEDWLSMEVIVKRANEQYFHAIKYLVKRYSSLSQKEYDEDTFPASILNLCQSLQKALRKCNVPQELLPVIYRIFDETVIVKLGELYDRLNAQLKSHNVLPNIESQQFKSKKTLRKNSLSGEANSIIPDNTVTPISNHKLFSAAKNILHLTRHSQIDDKETGGSENEQIVNQLSSIQNSPELTHLISQGGSLSQLLTTDDNISLNPQAKDLLELVESFFNNLNQYAHIPDTLTKKIRQLEVPIAQTALQEDDFFNNSDHPAHKLLNQIVDLCLNSDMPNRTLEKKFDHVIEQITQSEHCDDNTYSNAINELSSIANSQRNTSVRNIQRITQTYQGRQTVKQASEAVEKEISHRIIPPKAPTVAIDLLDNGWKELLKLTCIKEGPDSESWNEHLSTFDELLFRLSELEKTSTILSDNDELNTDTFVDKIEQQMNDGFPGNYRHEAAIENLRNVLKNKQAIAYTPITDQRALQPHNDNELQQELEAANPTLSRWFKRIKTFTSGDAFAYIDDETGQKNLKLAWVNDNHQEFVFVNHRGQKVFDFDQIDLANELANGLYPVEEKETLPLIERSLYSSVQQAYEKLAFKSTHDELTSLINRKECERLLNIALSDAKNKRHNHCLIYIDVDKFAMTNNLYGHLAGDQLLVDIGKLITSAVPDNCIIARMGGNEFAILIQENSPKGSLSIAEAVRKLIDKNDFFWQEHHIQLSVSISLVTINKYTENTIELIRNAVSACKTAKDNGGNRCYSHHHDAELQARREKLLAWIDQLSSILDSDRLVLRGQAIIPLDPGVKEKHYEILLALKNDDGSLISPVEFIEAAECYNRMQRVDRWVIESVFKWLVSLQQRNITLPFVSINLSGNSINDDQLMDFILDIFARYDVPTNKICFEITETATIDNMVTAADFIREIKKIGCKCSLDDFGSGNASYQYLKHLPVDYLKIDGEFVRNIHENLDDYALVKSINEIAHLMGKETIAEYTESEQILTVLKEIGVDNVQGYEVGMPTLLTTIEQDLINSDG
jgi:diguanylate cyclase (GGDEF)-like protein